MFNVDDDKKLDWTQLLAIDDDNVGGLENLFHDFWFLILIGGNMYYVVGPVQQGV